MQFEPREYSMIIDIEKNEGECLPVGRYVLWNEDKIERATSSLPSNASERDILIEYDKIGGLITQNDVRLPLQTLWNIEKKKQADSVENLTDDEIDVILRKAENVNVPGSRYQKVKVESEIRHRKKIEESLKKPKVSIGILNRGKNNKFINNTFKDFGVGIQDEGENTLAVGNKFTNFGKNVEKFYTKHPWWSALIIGSILMVLGYLLELVIGF